MNIPAGFLFSDDHEYCKVEGDVAIIGISDYAQSQLGDVTYLELPSVGDVKSKGDAFGTVEAVKAASDMFMPVSGEILEVNEGLNDSPETVNQDCYGAGWIVKVRLTNKSELDALMTAEAYKAHCEH